MQQQPGFAACTMLVLCMHVLGLLLIYNSRQHCVTCWTLPFMVHAGIVSECTSNTGQIWSHSLIQYGKLHIEHCEIQLFSKPQRCKHLPFAIALTHCHVAKILEYCHAVKHCHVAKITWSCCCSKTHGGSTVPFNFQLAVLWVGG